MMVSIPEPEPQTDSNVALTTRQLRPGRAQTGPRLSRPRQPRSPRRCRILPSTPLPPTAAPRMGAVQTAAFQAAARRSDPDHEFNATPRRQTTRCAPEGRGPERGLPGRSASMDPDHEFQRDATAADDPLRPRGARSGARLSRPQRVHRKPWPGFLAVPHGEPNRCAQDGRAPENRTAQHPLRRFWFE